MPELANQGHTCLLIVAAYPEHNVSRTPRAAKPTALTERHAEPPTGHANILGATTPQKLTCACGRRLAMTTWEP